MDDIVLRDALEEDLQAFFEFQLDEDALQMAAFTAENPSDREAFMDFQKKLLSNDAVTVKTIVLDGQVVGSVSCGDLLGKLSVGYWIAKEHWGKGIATQAVALLLEEIAVRPLYARVAKDNKGSIRVLEKNGFKIIGDDKGYANARGSEIEEYILELEAEK